MRVNERRIHHKKNSDGEAIFAATNENGNRYAFSALKIAGLRSTASCGCANGAYATFAKRWAISTRRSARSSRRATPKAIKAKHPFKLGKLIGSGKLGRLVLDAFRRAPWPSNDSGRP
jgi:hypothetical protein